jgi:hypothetical protein
MHPDIHAGANGGELGTCAGGHPSRLEVTSASVGKKWLNLSRDDIARQRLERPRLNWYQENNHLFQR